MPVTRIGPNATSQLQSLPGPATSRPPRGAGSSQEIRSSRPADQGRPPQQPYGRTPRAQVDFDNTGTAYALRSTRDLQLARLVFQAMRLPAWLTGAGMRVLESLLSARSPGAAHIVENTIFRVFCGGKDLAEAGEFAAKLQPAGVEAILDYAVEGESSEAGFDKTQAQFMRTIDQMARRGKQGFCAVKVSALAPRSLLAKAQGPSPLSEADKASLQRGRRRLQATVERASRCGVPILVDAEESWHQDTIDAWTEALMRQYNQQRPIVYTTVQLYRTDGLQHVEDLVADARQNGYIAGLKLVRGAYLVAEKQRAASEGRVSPLHTNKADTDADYNASIDLALKNLTHAAVVIATHNQESIQGLIAGMASRGISPRDPRIAVAQLLGMGDHFTFNMATQGYRAAKYVPYGPVREVLPYLARRVQENNAIAQQASGELQRINAELARRARSSTSSSSPEGRAVAG